MKKTNGLAILLGISLTLVGCGGGASSSGSAGSTTGSGGTGSGSAQASLTAPNSGKTPWNVATPIAVVLSDSTGTPVTGALHCISANTVALSVASDCSAVTGMRLGLVAIAVSAGGVTANVNIKVIPQAQPIGTQGLTQFHNLVVTPAGKVLAWGANYKGVLGQGKTFPEVNSVALPTPVKDQAGTGELSGIVAASTGREGTALALTEDGEVWSWGDYRSLGRTANVEETLPGKVRNAANNGTLSGIVAVSIGDTNAVALADDGTVYSWGAYPGQADGSSQRQFPGQVRAVTGAGVLSNVVAVSAGWNWTAALTGDGKVVAWGFNIAGATGQSTTIMVVDRPSYVTRDSDGAAVDGIAAISAGYNFGLALTNAAQVYAWGSNFTGQLGQNTQLTVQPRALQVKAADGNGLLSNIKMVSAGGFHAMALDQDGKVFAWGSATSSQLGDGPNRPVMNQAMLPRAVVNTLGIGQLSNIVAIATGAEHSLALDNDGRVLIWGRGDYQNLGQGGTNTTALAVPTSVKDSAGSGVLSLAPLSVWPNLTRLAR